MLFKEEVRFFSKTFFINEFYDELLEAMSMCEVQLINGERSHPEIQPEYFEMITRVHLRKKRR